MLVCDLEALGSTSHDIEVISSVAALVRILLTLDLFKDFRLEV